MRTVWKIVLPILVLAAGAAGAAFLVAMRPEAQRSPVAITPPVATTIRVDPAPRRIDAASQGEVRPVAVSPISAEVAGVVVSRSPQLEAGLLVEAGDELLRIDDADYRSAVAAAEAELADLRRRLTEEQAAAEVARAEWADLGQGEPSALTLRHPQIAAIEAGIVAAEARRDAAERDLERTAVRAPFTGRIGSKQVELGQRVAPGQELLRLEAAGTMEVVLPVTLEQLRFVDLPLRGQRLEDGPTVRLWGRIAEQRQEWRGRVVRTLTGIDERTRMVRAVARVEEDDAGPPLLAGLFVEAEIAGREVDDVVALPATAIQPGDRAFVVVPDGDGEAWVLEERTLSVLRRGRDQVLVTGPLAAGDRVVTVRLPQMRAGMRVRLADEDAAAGDDAATPPPQRAGDPDGGEPTE